MSTRAVIESLEFELKNARRAYLQRYGWKETCSTPGSYWLWKRDFVNEDKMREAIIAERKLPSPHVPYGVITANEDLAVQMTMKELDQEQDVGED